MRALVCCFSYCISEQSPVSTNVETAKTLKYGLVMISEGAGKHDGLTASCKVIATRTIVTDRKFIE
jgi:hypothetical protein